MMIKIIFAKHIMNHLINFVKHVMIIYALYAKKKHDNHEIFELGKILINEEELVKINKELR